jgi:hypothetical protein
MEQFRETWLKKSTIKSLLTALSLDALGSAYEQMPSTERIAWIDGGRVVLPRGARRTGTYNTDMVMILLTVFYTHRPEPEEPTAEITSYLRKVLRGYLEAVQAPRSTNAYVLALENVHNTMLGIPIGVVIGYYVALNSDESQTVAYIDHLLLIVKDVVPMSATNVDEARCVAVMLTSLLYDGYFGKDTIQQLYRYNAVPSALSMFFDNLLKHIFDADWMSPHFTHISLPSRMSYAQRVIAESVYYMARVSTQYDLDVLASNPKKQLIDIFNYPYTLLPDIAFVYGAICTSSEHGYSLVPKPLRLAIDSKHAVTDLIQGRE